MATKPRNAVAQTQPISGWDCEFERGPEWLIAKPTFQLPVGNSDPQDASLFAILWAALTQHFSYRLVIEIDQINSFPKNMVDDLTKLRDELEEHDGMLRFAGKNKAVEAEFNRREFQPILFSDREHAFMGETFRQPK